MKDPSRCPSALVTSFWTTDPICDAQWNLVGKWLVQNSAADPVLFPPAVSSGRELRGRWSGLWEVLGTYAAPASSTRSSIRDWALSACVSTATCTGAGQPTSTRTTAVVSFGRVCKGLHDYSGIVTSPTFGCALSNLSAGSLKEGREGL